MIDFDPPIVAGTTLVREAIQSQNYATGIAGWSINANGDVEFNNGIFRGTITAAQIIGSVFGSSLTDPSIWINEDGENELRVYNSTSDLVLRIGARPGTAAGATFYDDTDPFSLSIGSTIQWEQGSPLLTPFAAMYQTVNGILLNTQLAGGIAFDVLHGALVHLIPGSDNFEVWQTPTAATGWTIIFSQYRIDTMNNVVWDCAMQYTGANVTTASGSTMTAAIGSDYRPTRTRRIPAAHFTSAHVTKNTNVNVMINTDGTLSCSWGDGVAGSAHDVNAMATNDFVEFQISIPLGDIS